MLAREEIKIYHPTAISLPSTPDLPGAPMVIGARSSPSSGRTSSVLSDAVSSAEHIVRKTKRTPFHEAEIMQWIRDNTTVPVPREVRHGYDEESREYFLAYETPDGTPLDHCWDAFSTAEQQSLISQLRDCIQQLRRICPSQIRNSRASDAFLDPQDDTVRGPYLTTTEFVQALSTRIQWIGSLYEPAATRRVLGFLDALQRDSSADQNLVFTHGQLYPENIIVNDEGRIVAILDWSQAGYAPHFWEYIKSRLEEDDSNFFVDGVLDEILEPWPVQLAIMMHVRDIIWPA